MDSFTQQLLQQDLAPGQLSRNLQGNHQLHSTWRWTEFTHRGDVQNACVSRVSPNNLSNSRPCESTACQSRSSSAVLECVSQPCQSESSQQMCSVVQSAHLWATWRSLVHPRLMCLRVARPLDCDCSQSQAQSPESSSCSSWSMSHQSHSSWKLLTLMSQLAVLLVVCNCLLSEESAECVVGDSDFKFHKLSPEK